MKTPRLSVLEKIGFGAGDMAVNVVWSSMALILTFFYTDVFGLKASDIASLMLLPRLIDAFADVAMGMITDKHMTRWGRYRPYLLLFAVPFGLSVMLVYTTPALAYNAKLLWAYATYTLMMLVFTSVTIPYISLIGVLTEDPQERLSANGYRLFFAKVAAFMVTIIVPLMAARWGVGHLARGYQMSMALMAAMATLLFLFCFFTTTERVKHKVDSKPLLLQLQLLFKNDQWVVLAAVCVIATIGYVIRGSVAAYYAKYYLYGNLPSQPGGAVAIPHHAFLFRQMERRHHRRRGPAVKFPHHRRGGLHSRDGRFNLDHETLLQGPALSLEPDRHRRLQRHSLFCRQTR